MACVTLYTTANCSYCRRAKQLLDRRRLPYREIDLGMDRSGRDELVRRTGRMTFPQTFVDCRPIGGYAELEELIRRGGIR